MIRTICAYVLGLLLCGLLAVGLFGTLEHIKDFIPSNIIPGSIIGRFPSGTIALLLGSLAMTISIKKISGTKIRIGFLLVFATFPVLLAYMWLVIMWPSKIHWASFLAGVIAIIYGSIRPVFFYRETAT